MKLKRLYKGITVIAILFLSAGLLMSGMNPHDDQGSFPLENGHSGLECSACHAKASMQEYSGAEAECQSCHLKEYFRTTSPVHATQIFSPGMCSRCHNDTGWTPVSFTHERGAQQPCQACHMAELSQANMSVTGHGYLPNRCTMCHADSSWGTMDYDHTATGYTLSRAQAGQSCTSCHPVGFMGAPVDCDECPHTSKGENHAD